MQKRILRLSEIRKLVDKKIINMKFLSRETGISYNNIWTALKRNKNPSYTVIEKISDCIDKNFRERI